MAVGDADEVRPIVVNHCSMAITFTDPEGRLTVDDTHREMIRNANGGREVAV
jgi:hypothetical protein